MGPGLAASAKRVGFLPVPSPPPLPLLTYPFCQPVATVGTNGPGACSKCQTLITNFRQLGEKLFPTEWKIIKVHGSSHHQPDIYIYVYIYSRYIVNCDSVSHGSWARMGTHGHAHMPERTSNLFEYTHIYIYTHIYKIKRRKKQNRMAIHMPQKMR